MKKIVGYCGRDASSAYNTEYRHKPEPCIHKYEQKDGGYYGEESAGIFFTCYSLSEVEHCFDYPLRNILQTLWHKLHSTCGKEEEDYQQYNADPCSD